MKRNLIKIFLITLFLIGFGKSSDASSLFFDIQKDELGISEEFYVDLLIDTETKDINSVETTIIFSDDNLEFIRFDESKSILDLWIEKPKIENNKIHFSGISTNGFGGVIDPFNQKEKLPGILLRMVFLTSKSSDALFEISNAKVFLNDGLGTMTNAKFINKNIFINSYENKIKILPEEGTPSIEAHIVKDPDIFNNKYVLVFEARDDKSGIKEVLIKEGRRDWKKIESPYLLKDQTRREKISVLAVNHFGSSIILQIDGDVHKNNPIVVILVIISIIFVIIKIVRRNYGR